METTREPYEFLVRWIPEGLENNAYSGTVQAQINFAFVTRDDDGVVQSWTPDQKGPFPVALTGNDGIALNDIIPSMNAAALAELQTLSAEVDEANAAKQTAENAKSVAEAALAGKDTQIEALNDRITALTTAPAVVVISRMQALLALHDAGLLDDVEAIIQQVDARTKLAWDTATEFSRNSPTIIALWSTMGKTEQELDALFNTAKNIQV
jgi:hypothetical protein